MLYWFLATVCVRERLLWTHFILASKASGSHSQHPTISEFYIQLASPCPRLSGKAFRTAGYVEIPETLRGSDSLPQGSSASWSTCDSFAYWQLPLFRNHNNPGSQFYVPSLETYPTATTINTYNTQHNCWFVCLFSPRGSLRAENSYLLSELLPVSGTQQECDFKNIFNCQTLP